ncbi:hypothetical protein FHW94_000916 [Novosphingobium sp. SG720]|nr:hypothetical protein [Novosphingobium sp. SG720]
MKGMFDLAPRLRAPAAPGHVFPRSFGGIGCNQRMCQNGQDSGLRQSKTIFYPGQICAINVPGITGPAETEAKAGAPPGLCAHAPLLWTASVTAPTQACRHPLPSPNRWAIFVFLRK